MNKIVFPISIILVMLFASFATEQDRKVVRLKNGNYEVTNLKMEKSDIRAIAHALGLKLDSKDEKALGTNGYSWYLAVGESNEYDVFSSLVGSDVIHHFLYHEEPENPDDDNTGDNDNDAGDKDGGDKTDPQEEIDKIMRAYL